MPRAWACGWRGGVTITLHHATCMSIQALINFHMLTHVHLLQRNFGKPVEWGMVKDHPWSTPQLRRLDTPVSLNV